MNHLCRCNGIAFMLFVTLVSITSAKRFDSDELWNLEPSRDTTFRNLYLLPQFGMGLHMASSLECLDGGGCTPFTGGSGSVMSVSIGMDQVLSPRWTGIAMVSFNRWDVSMTTTDGAARVRMPDGSITNMVRELTMQASGTTIGLSVGALFRIGAFSFTTAPLIDIALSPRWSQRGKILSPAGVAYPDGTTSGVIVPDIAIPNAAPIRFGLGGTAGYEVSLSDKFSILPTVAVQYLPSPIRSGASWSDVRITGGIALRMEANDLADTVRKGLPHQITSHMQRTDTLRTLQIQHSERVIAQRRDEEVKVASEQTAVVAWTDGDRGALTSDTDVLRPKAMISISGKVLPLRLRHTQTGTTRAGTVETAEEFVDRTSELTEPGDTGDLLNRDVAAELAIKLTSERQELTFLVLPSIFFDSTSAEIPARYRRLSTTIGYKPGENVAEQHEANLDVLNIFAYRMKNSAQTLIIRGYADATSEGASCDLARARAASIARYLTDVWQIPTSKIRIEVAQSSCEPNPASSGSTLRGRQENRRVEFFSDDYEYFMPVQDQKVFLKPEWDFSRADITFDDALDPVREWSATFTQNHRVLAANHGVGRFHKSAVVINDSVLETLTADSVHFSIHITTEHGEQYEATMLIGVGQVQKELKFSSLSLAMFGVRSTELSKRDLELLMSFATRLDPGDSVAVLGYSDDLGSTATNQQLSLGRAKSVAERLRALRPDCVITRIEGLASSCYPLGVTSYNTPEQRFMSRTVQLVLEKK